MRQYDIVVFGATGFTGKHVAVQVARVSQENPMTFAIAGRSSNKLNEVRDMVLSEVPSMRDVDIIIADCGDAESLHRMASKAKVVISCVGPFRFYGEPVVRACLEAGTNYTDITGEPYFIENMMLKYHEEAHRKGITIVSACGFDSIPADLGTLFMSKEFYVRGGMMKAVDAFIAVQVPENATGAIGHYTTYESAVHGFAGANDLRRLRKNFPKVSLSSSDPRLPMHSGAYKEPRVNKWCFPFMGSDGSIVRNSMRLFALGVGAKTDEVAPIVQFGTYMTFSSFFSIAKFMVMGMMFQLFAKFSLGRKILLRFPSFFTGGTLTHEGPPVEQMKKTTFTMDFYGMGYKSREGTRGPWNYELHGRVSGPDPGYIATPICVVAAAQTLVRGVGKEVPPGVLTSATAFANTDIIKRLRSQGLGFEILDED